MMNRKHVVVAALLALLLVVSLTRTSIVRAEPVWDAKYWNNTTLSGNPVLQRGESVLDFDWGDGSPDPALLGERFSARWERMINVTAGTYRFHATMDDGMRVWVDGVLIIDGWWDSQVHSLSADRYLDGGDHQIKVEYYDAGGEAVAKLTRQLVSGFPSTFNAWRAEYFNNTSLSGAPVVIRDDPSIDFDWGTDAPVWNVVHSDEFSVRWTRNVSLNNGRYRFVVTADDGVRLWVNNNLILDEWHSSAATPYIVEVNLPGGTVPVKLEYYEGFGAAVAKLGWAQIGGTHISHWRGEYYSNKFLVGSPVMVRDDAQISFNWGYGSPASGVGADDFGVRWTRDLDLAAGRYRFQATSDDGVRLWVNHQLIIDQWYDRAAQTFAAEIDLPGGLVPVKLEYYENTQLSQVHLSWTASGGSPPPSGSPTSALVTAHRLNVRQGPGTIHAVITTIDRHTVVTLEARNETASWVKVMLPGGTRGWVSATYLSDTFKPFTFLPVDGSTVPTTTPPAADSSATVINAAALNVRTGPGVGYPVLTTIRRFDVVELAGFRNSTATWVKIRLPAGSEGWVNATYLHTDFPIRELAVGGF